VGWRSRGRGGNFRGRGGGWVGWGGGGGCTGFRRLAACRRTVASSLTLFSACFCWMCRIISASSAASFCSSVTSPCSCLRAIMRARRLAGASARASCWRPQEGEGVGAPCQGVEHTRTTGRQRSTAGCAQFALGGEAPCLAGAGAGAAGASCAPGTCRCHQQRLLWAVGICRLACQA
jgi:hypothetical protein